MAEAHRRYAWGIAYIDELIGFYDDDAVGGGGAPALHFVLTDANYNVATITDDAGEPVQQFAWMPYGSMLAAESITGGLGGTVTTIDFTANPELLLIPFGHQGLPTDLETGLIYNRARHLSPELGRFVQRDPYQSALLLNLGLARNATAYEAFLSLSPATTYRDGLSLYAIGRSNVIQRWDPTGQTSYLDLVSSGAKGLWIGYQIYDSAITIKDSVEIIVEAISARSITLDQVGELGINITTLGLDLLGGGVAGDAAAVALRSGGKKAAKGTLDALKEIGRHRRRVKKLMQELIEKGVDLADIERHHMIPTQVLKMLQETAPDIYSAVRGKRGAPNIFRIPTELHRYLHSDGNLGGWWNSMWRDVVDYGLSKNMSKQRLIDELLRIREVALDELGIREMVDHIQALSR